MPAVQDRLPFWILSKTFGLKSTTSLIVLVFLCLMAASSNAQGPLPIKWTVGSLNSVTATAYSPDGTLLVAAGSGGIRVYSTSTGFPILGIQTVATAINSIAFSPDGQTLLGGGQNTTNGVLESWNVATGKRIFSFPTLATDVASVAFSSDGTTIADGGIDSNGGVLETWNVTTGKAIYSLATSENRGVNAVAISSDGLTLAAGGSTSSAGVLELWNISTGTLQSTLPTLCKPIYALAFSSTTASSLLAGGINTSGGRIEHWNTATKSLTSTPSTGAAEGVYSIAISKNGKTFADCGHSLDQNGLPLGVVEYRNNDGGDNAIQTWETFSNAVTYAPDGVTIAVGGIGGTYSGVLGGIVENWNTTTVQLNSRWLAGGNGRLILSPDGKTLAFYGWSNELAKYGYGTASPVSGILQLWDVASGTSIAVLDSTNFPSAVAYSPDGKSLAVSRYNSTTQMHSLVMINATSGSITTNFPLDSLDGIYSLAFTPDGNSLVAGGTNFNENTNVSIGVLKVFNVSSGTLTYALKTNATIVQSLAVSPDNKTVAASGYNYSQPYGVELWDISGGSLIQFLPTVLTYTSPNVAFSPDGSTLAICGATFPFSVMLGEVELWNVTTRKLQVTLPMVAKSDQIESVAFSPDGSVLFAGAYFDMQAYNLSNDTLLDYYGQPASSQYAGGGSVNYTPSGNLIAYCNWGIVVSSNPLYQVKVSSVAVAPNMIGGGDPATATVTLTGAAPVGGTIVTFSSSNSSLASVSPSSIIIPEGLTQGTTTVQTTPVSSNATATISATYASSSASATITVIPIALTGISINPTTINGGGMTYGTVSLNTPAPPGGAVVSLTSGDPAVTVPASMAILAGSPSGSFPINSTAVNSSTTVTISATYSGFTQQAKVTILPATVYTVSISPSSVVGGTASVGTVTLTGPAGSAGTVVNLTSSIGSATAPGTVTVPAGSTSVTFNIATSAVSNQVTATITATIGSVSKTATLTISPSALISFSVSPPSLQGGTSATGTVTMAGPAGSGGAVVSLASSSANATLPSSITIPAGATTSTFTIATTAVSSLTTATLTASLSTVSLTATLVINPPTLQSVSVAPTSLVGGSSSLGTVTLSSPAPSGGLAITLSSSEGSASVPNSVTVLAGSTSATFNVATTPVAATSTDTIMATLASVSKTATLRVNPPGLISFTIAPTSVIGGSSATGTVTLGGPAPSGGTTINLSSNSGSASVANSVTVTAGTTTATFTIGTTIVTSSTTATIIASQAGGNSLTATLAIQTALLSSLSVSPSSVIGGNSATGTVTLVRPAPSGGASISVTSSSSNAIVSGPVIVAGGATTATFPISTLSVTSSVTTTVTASLSGTSKSTTLMITPLALVSISLSPASVPGGIASTGTISLNGPAGAGGVSVGLTSSLPQAAMTPSSVTVPSGSSTATFTVSTVAVTAQKTATIKASFNTTSQSATLTINPPTLQSISLNPTTVPGGASSTGTATLTAPAAATTVVKLSSNSKKASCPGSVTIGIGKTSATFTVTTLGVSSQAIATITGTLGTASQSAQLTITAPTLVSISVSPSILAGGSISTGTVTLSGAAPSGGLVVSLSSNQSAATVPATATVASGQMSATFTVKTIAVSTETSVTLTAKLNNISGTTTVTLTPPTVKSVTLSPTSVVGGKTSIGTVTISIGAPTGGLTIALSATGSSATVPTTMTIPAGKTSATFTVKTSAVTSKTTSTITATSGTSSQPVTLTVT